MIFFVCTPHVVIECGLPSSLVLYQLINSETPCHDVSHSASFFYDCLLCFSFFSLNRKLIQCLRSVSVIVTACGLSSVKSMSMKTFDGVV